VSRAIKILISGIIALGVLALFFISNEKTKINEKLKKEAFTSPDPVVYKETKKLFTIPTAENPMMNVLLTDYENNPNKKPAPASYNASNNTDILAQAKEFVKEANPDQPDIADKLFKNLGDELQFEQSMRPFYSTPNTRVVNDQQAFADFCYGSMISCKEGNMFACSRKYQSMPSMA
jgi:hypothetical protein